MKITDIPNEVWAAACIYEDIDWESWELKDIDSALNRAKEAWEYETYKRGYTDAGLEKAISDYLLHTGAFAENGKFSEIFICWGRA